MEELGLEAPTLKHYFENDLRRDFFVKIKKCVMDEKNRNKKYWVGNIAIKNDGSAGLP